MWRPPEVEDPNQPHGPPLYSWNAAQDWWECLLCNRAIANYGHMVSNKHKWRYTDWRTRPGTWRLPPANEAPPLPDPAQAIMDVDQNQHQQGGPGQHQQQQPPPPPPPAGQQGQPPPPPGLPNNQIPIIQTILDTQVNLAAQVTHITAQLNDIQQQLRDISQQLALIRHGDDSSHPATDSHPNGAATS